MLYRITENFAICYACYEKVLYT